MVTACGGDDNGFDTCEVDEDCDDDYVCGGGVCRYTGPRSGGDSITGGDDNTPGDGGGDAGGGDSGGGDGGGDSGGGDASADDVEGPTIANFQPAAATRGQGIMIISADVFDTSGVASVVAIVGATNTPTSYTSVTLEKGAGDSYIGRFDTSNFKPGTAFPYIEMTARDALGNLSRSGHSIVIDWTTPLLSFTSPRVQAIDSSDKCSQPWYPLGNPAGIPWHFEHGRSYDASAFQVVPRLRVQDRGNPAIPVVVHSGINPASVKVYITPVSASATLPPLLLPETAGGACALINPSLIPQAGVTRPSDAYVLDFQQVEPAGQASFVPGGGGAGLACTPDGSGTETPDAVCDTGEPEGIRMWIPYGGNRDMAVWVAAGYDPESLLTCTGTPFDFANLNAEGTFCAAATATDGAGNVGVSEPLVFCVDGPAAGNPCSGLDFATLRTRCVQSCSFDAEPFGTAVQTFRLD